jgi:hypothetical protein
VSVAYQVIGDDGSPDFVLVRRLMGDLLSLRERPLLVRRIVFEPAGEYERRRVPDRCRLYRVVDP